METIPTLEYFYTSIVFSESNHPLMYTRTHTYITLRKILAPDPANRNQIKSHLIKLGNNVEVLDYALLLIEMDIASVSAKNAPFSGSIPNPGAKCTLIKGTELQDSVDYNTWSDR